MTRLCALLLVPGPLTVAKWVLSKNTLNNAVASTTSSAMWVPVMVYKLSFLLSSVRQIMTEPASVVSLIILGLEDLTPVSKSESAFNKDAR